MFPNSALGGNGVEDEVERTKIAVEEQRTEKEELPRAPRARVCISVCACKSHTEMKYSARGWTKAVQWVKNIEKVFTSADQANASGFGKLSHQVSGFPNPLERVSEPVGRLAEPKGLCNKTQSCTKVLPWMGSITKQEQP